ncbi:hypothetical protein ACFRKB_38535 [Streptomyces scopuliridis]|uniref:hypothetical protein n=1 Tax=Streptomyces scopuliridis TaxID=452529 RepID=UPI0036CF72B8
MAKTVLTRGAMIGAAAAVLIGFASAPASAANFGIQLPNGRGYMTFIDGGDEFIVCDTKVDDHGVTGYLRTVTTDGRIVTVDTWSDGGDSGCGGGTHDIIGNQPHDMVLCWHGGGACVVSRVFDENE